MDPVGNVFPRKAKGKLPRAIKAEGIWITDQNGRRYIDASGWAVVVNLGHGRREIAEERGAQLFVSIHFNAAPSRKARGSEVFFVSMKGAEDRETKELEMA